MAKIEVTRTELVWPGKYDQDGTLVRQLGIAQVPALVSQDGAAEVAATLSKAGAVRVITTRVSRTLTRLHSSVGE